MVQWGTQPHQHFNKRNELFPPFPSIPSIPRILSQPAPPLQEVNLLGKIFPYHTSRGESPDLPSTLPYLASALIVTKIVLSSRPHSPHHPALPYIPGALIATKVVGVEPAEVPLDGTRAGNRLGTCVHVGVEALVQLVVHRVHHEVVAVSIARRVVRVPYFKF